MIPLSIASERDGGRVLQEKENIFNESTLLGFGDPHLKLQRAVVFHRAQKERIAWSEVGHTPSQK
jgi:hypothetical protein